jgi:hypothetical protein
VERESSPIDNAIAVVAATESQSHGLVRSGEIR